MLGLLVSRTRTDFTHGGGEMMDNAIARRGALALWDVASWTFATALVIGVRHDFRLTEVQWESVVCYWLTRVVLCSSVWVTPRSSTAAAILVGSFDEAFGLALHLAVVGAVDARHLGDDDEPGAPQRRRSSRRRWPC